ncbi:MULTISPECIES: MurR/RpiR family transcriptional regulator [unclassified Lactococcus]|uniref:MurR/RpiR family transcriptional regulator n=1 Tax=unclassified Lactococcus TaxID=2643510 RepID=UPI0011C70A0B|nr:MULTISPECIES: MurR/RpiR family transcriptional regulator [unclassified Lactococcus]MQW22529.1 SIS domain-containing protein [Lactococcus sp. dk101]TXK45553.1 MurR/RpiR family transcriptional regulator [Lactococcus sp. dk310]TXK51403.1 MurR/RpiR family transcriptional regulator [Lactococcus sp. dk322]
MAGRNLSSAESYTWKMIQDNYENIPQLSISALADLAHVSISTVNRTVKKKGFAGYSDFRYSVKENRTSHRRGFSKEVLEAISKNEEELLKTINGILPESIEEAVQAIEDSTNIIIFARGLSINAAQEMKQKLQLWHKNVILYDDARSMHYFAKFATKETLLVVISLFGETEEIIDATRIAKTNGAKILVLTATQNSTVTRLADISLVGYKSHLEVNYFELDVHSRLPLYILVRVLFDSYSIYKNK